MSVADLGSTSIAVFAANPSGTLNEAPVANIPRNSTTTLNYPWGIALDANGNIYTLDSGRILVFLANPVGTVSEAPLATIAGSNTQLDGGNDNILESAANPPGTLNEAPVATIAGSNTGLNSPTGITFTGTFNIDSVKRKAKGHR